MLTNRFPSIRTLIAVGVAALALAGCGPQKTPAGSATVAPRAANETRPNILLIVIDHLGPEFAAYGDKTAQTPNLDRLAKSSEVFAHAYSTSASDDASYAAVLTGVHPQTIGMVQEWTGTRVWNVAPPPEVHGFPETLRAAGYHTFHLGPRTDPFEASSSLWTEEVLGEPGVDTPAWPTMQIGQPFFGEIDLTTLDAAPDATESKTGWFGGGRKPAATPAVKPVDPQAIKVPDYLPDSHSMRVALAHRYEAIERVDAQVGEILARLDKLGLTATTDIIVTARTGPALPRAERTLYESGVRVPLIVHRADGRGAASVRQDLVSLVDVAPSILTRAGLKPFAWMQGRERFVSAADPERYAFSTQGRVGAVYERAFAVRDGRWLYIHNLAFSTPVLSLSRPGPVLNAFRAVARETRRVAAPGLPLPAALTPAQARIMSPDRPEDEFYDLQKDPFQMNNLAEEDKYANELQRLSDALSAFLASALDYSTWEARDLQDLYRPGGITPTAAKPSGVITGDRIVLDSATPGAVLLWRPAVKSGVNTLPWRIYTGPVPAAGGIESKAARYGFQESAIQPVNTKPR